MFNYIKFDLFLQSNFWEVASNTDNYDVRKTNQEQKTDVKDLTWLSTKEKEQYEKLQKRIDELQHELNIVNPSIGVVDNRRTILEQNSNEKISFRELSEKWAYEVNERIIKLRAELWELQEQKDVLLRSIDLAKVNKLSESELKQMQTITSKEFLSTPPSERLKFITVWNINSTDVKKWWVESLDFTFTYDWKFNRELYIKTTAWQTLPETVRNVKVDWVEYTRTWLNWEFFSQDWKRLLIHEWTKVDVTKFWTEEELKQIWDKINENLGEFKNSPNEELALESLKKWFDPKFVVTLFGEKISSLQSWKKETIEEILTDIARLQDDFKEDFPNETAILDWAKPSEKFAWYVINSLKTWKESNIAELYWYNLDSLKTARRVNNPSLGWGPVNLEKINIDWISKEEVDAILKKDKFTPWSKDAQVLFLAACQSANLPLDWCNDESLHRILSKESNWVVWRLNYTIKWHTPESFKWEAVNSTSNNPIWARSTASGLWQLLLSNVDKYYPDWRSGIWDPLNEAVWMLRYINDRYWTPDIAWSVYWKEWSYDHPTRWRQHKWFAEWY